MALLQPNTRAIQMLYYQPLCHDKILTKNEEKVYYKLNLQNNHILSAHRCGRYLRQLKLQTKYKQKQTKTQSEPESFAQGIPTSHYKIEDVPTCRPKDQGNKAENITFPFSTNTNIINFTTETGDWELYL